MKKKNVIPIGLSALEQKLTNNDISGHNFSSKVFRKSIELLKSNPLCMLRVLVLGKLSVRKK